MFQSEEFSSQEFPSPEIRGRRLSGQGDRHRTRAKQFLAVAIMTMLGVLSSMVVLAPSATALPSAEATAAVAPTFVSPAPGESLSSGYGWQGWSRERILYVEMDHAGLDIASGWLFVGTEAGASDLGRVHMGSGTTTNWDIVPSTGEVHLTYIYRVAGNDSWQRVAQSHTVGQRPQIGVVGGSWGSLDFLGSEVTEEFEIARLPEGVESVWVMMRQIGAGPNAEPLFLQHLGTKTSSVLTVPNDQGPVLISFFYKIAGRWNAQHQATWGE